MVRGDDQGKNEALLQNEMEQNTGSKKVANISPDGLSLRCFTALVPHGLIKRKFHCLNLTESLGPGDTLYKLFPKDCTSSGKNSQVRIVSSFLKSSWLFLINSYVESINFPIISEISKRFHKKTDNPHRSKKII